MTRHIVAFYVMYAVVIWCILALCGCAITFVEVPPFI
jgi:hypothetical protein